MKHLRLTTNDEEFWNFSWDEMAQYDLPAMIDFILKYKQQSNLIYYV